MTDLEKFERLLDNYRNAVEAYSSTPLKGEDWNRHIADAFHHRKELMDLMEGLIDDADYYAREAANCHE